MRWVILGTGHLKTTLQNFYIIFLSSDFSVNICSIIAKSLRNVVYCLSGGSVSQNLDLSPGYFFYVM